MKDKALLDLISKQPHGKAGIKHLYKLLHLQGDARAPLETALDRMTARGELIELPNNTWVVASRSREFVAGRVSMHRDGYGFLIPDRPIEGISGDVYLPRGAVNGVMNGDRAIVRISGARRDGRAEGEIWKVLKRAHPTVVGEFRITRRGMFVAPHDERLTEWIEIPADMAIPPPSTEVNRIGVKSIAISDPSDLDGMIVNAEVLDYGDGNPIGRITEILGFRDDFGIDVEIIIRKHHIPHFFPPEVIAAAQSVPEFISTFELEGRRDFRDRPIVTIDGETARDFDDAVLVDRLPNGNFALQVHIADVSHYVKPGGAIDQEARLRGTSVYFPDRAVPMLPFELSTNICSLVPHQDRLVVSALIEIDPRGEPVSYEFCRGVIRSAERMTYTNVHLVLEGDPAQRQRYASLVERFETMRELAEILQRKRYKRGSIDFDLPEPLIEFDESGVMTGIARSPRNIANRIIEEFMLAANEAVAAHLAFETEKNGGAAIYRVHEQPDPKRIMEFEEVAAQFGYSLGVGAIPVSRHRYKERASDGRKMHKDVVTPKEIKLSSKAYQKLVAKIEGKPEERILSYLMLRSLKQARYSEENTGHFALAASHYTHFTSPIRRYPDLIVHRLLTDSLTKLPLGKDSRTASVPLDEAAMKAIADECSLTERRAAEAERELVEWKKAKFMESRVGDEFDGLIISAARYGLFVELADLFVEGLIPIESLPGDRYTYHENVRKIIGQRTRREFCIGERVRVVLDRVDPLERKLQFSLVEPVSRKKTHKSQARH
ncbi:MAG TPA: VacB/RNase II family 3'-5' exoribonuclease [Bryobacteraceae bacterium]|jgi:ribonuclease R|nr:VacB/RNase II family 3'-5' exoribonuclease [Bryobacteraceae bacterium]